MRKTTFITGAVLFLVLAPQAMAHAKVLPEKTPADGVARITLELPGEESVPATRVALQLPRGVSDVKLDRAPGWKGTVSGRVITWSGGAIAPDEVGKFVFRARMPATPGAELAFPTVQTYANGVIARWIGAPGSDMPAPRLMLTAAKKQQPPPPPPLQPPPAPPPGTATVPFENDDGTDLSWWLLLAGVALGLGTALAVARRRRG